MRRLLESGEAEDVSQYLDGVFNTVLLKDVAMRLKLTLARELRPLDAIDDNYPKTLITGDDTNPVMHNGIRQVSICDFLLSDEHIRL